MNKLLFPCLMIFLMACQANGKVEYSQKEEAVFNPQQYVCYRAGEKMTIDGNLDEQAWKNAPWTNEFADIEGDAKPKPQYLTKAKMLWDDEYLYIGAYLQEPHLWASITERDAVIFYDNDFEVFIDPDGDTHGYYEFEMNAFNTVWDLLLAKPYRDGGPAINNWDINGLQSAVALKGTINNPDDIDEGWFVEMAFPLDVLHEYAGGVKAEAGNQWRINFSRVQWQMDVVDGSYQKRINPETNKSYPEDNWVWSPQSYINMHRPETWGFMQFSDLIAGQGEEAFVFNEDESVKWELYRLYHAQRAYKNSTGQYADDMALLKNVGLSDSKYISSVNVTTSLYEAIASSSKSDYYWHINNEGRTWKSKK
ncbi:carbohydrate-binding family 9-like protein [Carboxylicivirga sp. RSCT41]|uniref:carbohydrate-binding family 9-like protein n=1 Tax=Carboxylicivirga agarovorans TaxID=3417570 RepID=UPI003D347332